MTRVAVLSKLSEREVSRCLDLAGANNEVAVTTGEKNKRHATADDVDERVLYELALGDANVNGKLHSSPGNHTWRQSKRDQIRDK